MSEQMQEPDWTRLRFRRVAVWIEYSLSAVWRDQGSTCGRHSGGRCSGALAVVTVSIILAVSTFAPGPDGFGCRTGLTDGDDFLLAADSDCSGLDSVCAFDRKPG